MYILKSGGIEFHIEHGHRYNKTNKNFFLRTYFSILKGTEGTCVGKIIRNISHLLEKLGYLIFGKELMNGSSIAKKQNQLIKDSLCGEMFTILGDTHFAEIDEKNRYANTGSIGYRQATYIIIEDGNIKLEKTRY